MRDLGQGTQAMPEFMRPRYMQGSITGRIWQWHSYEQGSNAHRKFEVTDKAGLVRYHCKSCHSYYLTKAPTLCAHPGPLPPLNVVYM